MQIPAINMPAPPSGMDSIQAEKDEEAIKAEQQAAEKRHQADAARRANVEQKKVELAERSRKAAGQSAGPAPNPLATLGIQSIHPTDTPGKYHGQAAAGLRDIYVKDIKPEDDSAEEVFRKMESGDTSNFLVSGIYNPDMAQRMAEENPDGITITGMDMVEPVGDVEERINAAKKRATLRPGVERDLTRREQTFVNKHREEFAGHATRAEMYSSFAQNESARGNNSMAEWYTRKAAKYAQLAGREGTYLSQYGQTPKYDPKADLERHQFRLEKAEFLASREHDIARIEIELDQNLREQEKHEMALREEPGRAAQQKHTNALLELQGRAAQLEFNDKELKSLSHNRGIGLEEIKSLGVEQSEFNEVWNEVIVEAENDPAYQISMDKTVAMLVGTNELGAPIYEDKTTKEVSTNYQRVLQETMKRLRRQKGAVSSGSRSVTAGEAVISGIGGLRFDGRMLGDTLQAMDPKNDPVDEHIGFLQEQGVLPAGEQASVDLVFFRKDRQRLVEDGEKAEQAQRALKEGKVDKFLKIVANAAKIQPPVIAENGARLPARFGEGRGVASKDEWQRLKERNEADLEDDDIEESRGFWRGSVVPFFQGMRGFSGKAPPALRNPMSGAPIDLRNVPWENLQPKNWPRIPGGYYGEDLDQKQP